MAGLLYGDHIKTWRRWQAWIGNWARVRITMIDGTANNMITVGMRVWKHGGEGESLNGGTGVDWTVTISTTRFFCLLPKTYRPRRFLGCFTLQCCKIFLLHGSVKLDEWVNRQKWTSTWVRQWEQLKVGNNQWPGCTSLYLGKCITTARYTEKYDLKNLSNTKTQKHEKGRREY